MVSVRIPPRVAGQTTEHLEIVGIGMAGRTVIPGVPARGDWEPGVVESSLIPGCVGGSMARITSCRKPGRRMVRVLGLLVVGLMAAITFARCPGVNPILMTSATSERRMDALEREETAVVEIRLVPGGVGGPMARITGRRKSGGHVIGVSGLLVVGAVAAVTFSRGPGVYPVFMTGRTLKRGMDTLAGKDTVMVERGLIPAGVGRQMAELASRRETRLDVVWLGGLLIIFTVAGIAVEYGQAEVSVLVATVTAEVAVSGVERHPCPGAVVPAYGGPGDGTVAVLAVGAQRRPVAVVLAADPVAVIAAHGRPFINPVQMAGGAGNLKVASLERKCSPLVKSAGDRVPALRSVTGFAFLRHRALVGLGMAEAAISVIRHVGTDLMTGGTVPGQAGVLSFESEPGLRGMVEVFRVERPDINVGALMLLVAGLAIPGDFAMDAFFGGDPVGDRLVAGQAAAGIDLFAGGVAFPAVCLAF